MHVLTTNLNYEQRSKLERSIRRL